MTLHQLRVFRAVARHRSFTRAAEELLLTQSAVSAQMRALTELLGVHLLEQFGKKVYLTDAGRALLDQAGRIAAIVSEIDQEFIGYREEGAGNVRVGASTSIGTYFFPSLIADFTGRHPKVDVSLEIENTAHVQERLLRNDFDIAYLGAAVTSPNLVAEPFLEDEVFFACEAGHPLAALNPVTAEQLARFKLLVREPGSATRRTMESYCGARGIVFPHVAQMGSVEAIKQAVMAGLGFSYFSSLTVGDEVSSGRLVRLTLGEIAITRSFLEVRHRQKRATPALEGFLEFARAWASDNSL
jgi:DNA-binding transcriptional LysR family regulator